MRVPAPIPRPDKHSRGARPTKASIAKRAKRVKVTLAKVVDAKSSTAGTSSGAP